MMKNQRNNIFAIITNIVMTKGEKKSYLPIPVKKTNQLQEVKQKSLPETKLSFLKSFYHNSIIYVAIKNIKNYRNINKFRLKPKGIISTTADDLINEIKKTPYNSILFNVKYNNIAMEVTGMITGIYKYSATISNRLTVDLSLKDIPADTRIKFSGIYDIGLRFEHCKFISIAVSADELLNDLDNWDNYDNYKKEELKKKYSHKAIEITGTVSKDAVSKIAENNYLSFKSQNTKCEIQLWGINKKNNKKYFQKIREGDIKVVGTYFNIDESRSSRRFILKFGKILNESESSV